MFKLRISATMKTTTEINLLTCALCFLSLFGILELFSLIISIMYEEALFIIRSIIFEIYISLLIFCSMLRITLIKYNSVSKLYVDIMIIYTLTSIFTYGLYSICFLFTDKAHLIFYESHHTFFYIFAHIIDFCLSILIYCYIIIAIIVLCVWYYKFNKENREILRV
jgi:hypothetical protein